MKNTLTIAKHDEDSFSCLPTPMQEALLKLAAVTWAGDLDMETSGPEFYAAHNDACEYLRAHGLYPVWN